MRRRATPLATAAVLSVLVMTLASACGGSSTSPASAASKPEKADLVVGQVPSEANAALYVAQLRGLFVAHGLHVKLADITSTDTIVPDLLHGSMDIGAGQLTTFIGAQASGLGPFRVLASGLELGHNVNEIMALKPSGVTSPADLKGKTIAVNAAAGNGVLLTDAILSAYNIRPGQVTLVPVPFPDMAAALQAHRVAAVYSTQPYVTEMEQQFGATVVADLDQGAAQGYPISGYTATTGWADRYPRTGAAFAAAISQASAIINSDPATARKALETYLKISPKVADVMAIGKFPTSVSTARLQQLANLMLEFGELKSRFNAGALAGRP
jgi:NitT/TauT family transport system substrate-binding protein